MHNNATKRNKSISAKKYRKNTECFTTKLKPTRKNSGTFEVQKVHPKKSLRSSHSIMYCIFNKPKMGQLSPTGKDKQGTKKCGHQQAYIVLCQEQCLKTTMLRNKHDRNDRAQSQGRYFRNFWVGMYHRDPGTLSLYTLYES